MIFKSPYKQLNRKVNTWCKYTQRLDTYGLGCEHNCHYCYAKSLLWFRDFWHTPAPATIECIRKSILKLNLSDVVRIGGMTDCFQSIEQANQITFKTIRLLNIYHINYLIVTKSDLVADDRYIAIYDKKLAHFQITITSTSANKYENAPTPEKRIRAIEKLYRFGFDVSVRLSPYLPDLIDYKILARVNCDKILIEFLKVNPFIKRSFNIDYSDYTLNFGGFQHLQLENKIELINRIYGFDQVSIGEYVHEHHLYFRENINYNKNDCCNLNLSFYPEPQLKLAL